MGTIRVLHVDDEPEFGSLVADCLEREDDAFEVYSETNVDAALDHLSGDGVDCVVSDYAMPGTDGIEFLELVREHDETLPFILFTGKGSESVASQAFSAGATDYLQKADGTDQFTALADRIREYVDDRRAQSRRRSERAAVEATRAVGDAARVNVDEEAYRRYETLVESLGDPVYALDEEGRFTDVNDAFLELTGYDRETVIGSLPTLIKDEAAVETAERNLARLLSSDRPDSVTFEIDVRPAEGEPIPVEDHMGVLWDEDGSFVGSVGTLRDLTERVEARRRLREEKLLLDRSLDALTDIYYLLDAEGQVQRWNSSLKAVTGYSDAELDGRDSLSFFEGEDRERLAEAVAEAIDTGSARVEANLVTKSGRAIPYEFTGGRLDDQDGEVRGVIGVGRDVTERRAYERQLERKNERLEEFASVVSHDLRNPLNVAQGRIQMLRNSADEDDEADLETVERSLDRMEALVEDLLSLARDGENVDETESVDLGELFQVAWETVDTEGATLRVETTATVQADAFRLQQLAENLLSNAVEHGSTSPASQTQQAPSNTATRP